MSLLLRTAFAGLGGQERRAALSQDVTNPTEASSAKAPLCLRVSNLHASNYNVSCNVLLLDKRFVA